MYKYSDGGPVGMELLHYSSGLSLYRILNFNFEISKFRMDLASDVDIQGCTECVYKISGKS